MSPSGSATATVSISTIFLSLHHPFMSPKMNAGKNPVTPKSGYAMSIWFRLWVFKSAAVLFTTFSICCVECWSNVEVWFSTTCQSTMIHFWYSRYASNASIKPIPIIAILMSFLQSQPIAYPIPAPPTIGSAWGIREFIVVTISTTISFHTRPWIIYAERL